MAGDWIPIQCSLPDSPKVARIASLVKIDADAVVGKLVRMWRWFGEHTTNGVTHIGAEFIDDRVVFCVGFVAACAHPEVRYAIIDGTKLTLPEWTRWNGSAAKTRLKDNQRRAKNRAKDVPDLSRSKRDTCPENVPPETGPENRTEQNKTESKLKNPPAPQRSARKNGAPKMNGSANDGFLIGPISNGNDAPLSAEEVVSGKPPDDDNVAPQGNETLNWAIAKKAGIEPFRYISRAFIAVGLEEEVACELAGKVWSRPEVADELVNRCVEVNPDNPTGWMITRLRERKLIGR